MLGSSWWEANVDNKGFCVIISPGQQPAIGLTARWRNGTIKALSGPKAQAMRSYKSLFNQPATVPCGTPSTAFPAGKPPSPSLKQPCHPGELRHPFIRGFASSSQKPDTPSLWVGFRGHPPVTTTQASAQRRYRVGTGISRASCCWHRWYLGSADDNDLDHRLGEARSPS